MSTPIAEQDVSDPHRLVLEEIVTRAQPLVLRGLCREWPLVREAHMLAGDADFMLKCVAPDLTRFQEFVLGELTTLPNVSSVKTTVVLRTAKSEPGVPLEPGAANR